MFNKHDLTRNGCMLTGSFAKCGYDWWWHSFTAINEETGEEKPFFVEFFLCNPALAEEKPVLGQLPANKESGKRPSYLMIKAGCWGRDHRQIHRFFSWKNIEVQKSAPFFVRAEDCFVSDTELIGKVSMMENELDEHPEYMCDAGTIEWNLRMDKKIAFNVGYGASRFFRALKAFEMYWHAEGMKTAYCGTVILDGVRYRVMPETSYGYADKNWGRGFTSPWIWLSSNHMISNITHKKLEDSVFDIGGGRPKIFFVPLERQLLSAFWYEGKEYEFNFSKFWTGTKTKFVCRESEEEIIWRIIQENRKAILKVKVHCRKSDMLFVNYEAPDGSKRHNRLWNGGNGTGRILLYEKPDGKKKLVDDITVSHIGCEYGEYDSER